MSTLMLFLEVIFKPVVLVFTVSNLFSLGLQIKIPEVIAALKRLIRTIDHSELDPNEFAMINQVYYKIGPKEFQSLAVAAHRHSDSVFRDLRRRVLQLRGAKEKQITLYMLRWISPDHPLTIASIIQFDWKSAAPKAAEWEKKYRNDADVIIHLGKQFYLHKRYADCERVWKRYVELGLDKGAYSNLANLYYHLKKYLLNF